MKKFLSFFAVMFALLSTALPGWGYSYSDINTIRLIGEGYTDSSWSYDDGLAPLTNSSTSTNKYYIVTNSTQIKFKFEGNYKQYSCWNNGDYGISYNSDKEIWPDNNGGMYLTVDNNTPYLITVRIDNGAIKVKVNKYKWVLRGNWDGGSDWTDTSATYSNGKWTGSVTVSGSNTSSFGIKETTHDTEWRETNWFFPNAAISIANKNGTQTVTGAGSSNQTIANGSYNFEITPGQTGSAVSVKFTRTDGSTVLIDPSPYAWMLSGTVVTEANVTFGGTYPSFSKPSDLTVDYGVYSDAACNTNATGASVSDGTINVTKAGTYYIKAFNAADSKYKAAQSVLQLTVTKGSFTPAWSADGVTSLSYGESLSGKTWNKATGVPTGATVTYYVGSGAPVTINASTGDIIAINGVGTATVTATFDGGANYDTPTDLTYDLVVDKGSFTPAWSNGVTSLRLSDNGNLSGKTWKTVTGVPADVTVTYSVSPEDVVSINQDTGAITSIVGVGSASVSATFAVGDNYNQPATLAPYTITVRDAAKMPANVYLVGLNGDWSLQEQYKFHKNGNIYTLSVPNGINGPIKIWDGSMVPNSTDWAWSFGKGSATPVLNSFFNLAFSTSGGNIDGVSTIGPTKITFIIDQDNDENAKLKIEGAMMSDYRLYGNWTDPSFGTPIYPTKYEKDAYNIYNAYFVIPNWAASNEFRIKKGDTWYSYTNSDPSYTIANDNWVGTEKINSATSFTGNFKLNSAAAGKSVVIRIADTDHNIKAIWEAPDANKQPYIYVGGSSHDMIYNAATELFEYTIDATSAPVNFRLQNSNNSTALGTNVSNVALVPSGDSSAETTITSNSEGLTVYLYGDYNGHLKVSDGKYVLGLTSKENEAKLYVRKVYDPATAPSVSAEVHRWNLENSWTPSHGKYRLFYMSSKQNGSRVSPEWELLPQGNGEYLLDEFMVIPGGNFFIRAFQINSDGEVSVAGDYALKPSSLAGNQHYTIKKSTSGLSGDLDATKHLRKSTVPLAKDQAFTIWEMGHTIVSIRAKFTDSEKQAMLSYDLRKPSTLRGAPIQGIPFIALNGQDIVAMPIEGGHNFIYDIESQGAPTSGGYIGFTNGWLQFDDESKVYVYDDNKDYYTVTDKGVMNTQGPRELMGKSMYNTIQPPRNPVWFYNPTTGKTFSSDKMTFKYKGHGADAGAVITDDMLVNPTNSSNNGAIKKGVDFALYEIRDINMSGNYKIWTGHGSYIYGNTYNGLSFNTNWGVNTDSNIYSAEEVQSKFYRPMTGSGTYEVSDGTTDQKTTRPNGTPWAGDGSSYSYEDNDVGKYFKWKLAEGATSTYVSNLQFYFALEGDYPDSTNHNSAKGALGSTHNVTTKDDTYLYDNDLTGSTGRNYSWLYCNYEGNSTMIELAKSGTNTGVTTYAVNPSQTAGASQIHSYTVTLFSNATANFDLYTKEEAEDDPSKLEGAVKGGNVVQSFTVPCTQSGDDNEYPRFIETDNWTVPNLTNGYYIAQIVAVCEDQHNPGQTVSYVSTSDIIRVVGIAGKPKLTAVQQIEVDPVSELSTYTFNVRVQADVADINSEMFKGLGEAWYASKLKARYIFPFKEYSNSEKNENRHIWLGEYPKDDEEGNRDETSDISPSSTSASTKVQPLTDAEDPENNFTHVDGYAVGKNNNRLYYYDFDSLSDSEIENETYRFPPLVIEDYVPGRNYEFYVIITGEEAGLANSAKASANATIKMPQAEFIGTASLEADKDNGYNYVNINGHFALVDAILEKYTDPLYTTDFSLQIENPITKTFGWVYKNETTKEKKKVSLDELTDEWNTVEFTRLPYVVEDGSNERTQQVYRFKTDIDYIRTADGATASPETMVESTISLALDKLIAPRDGIMDTKTTSEEWEEVVNTESSVASGSDQITIIEKVKEGFYGAISIYNDALIAAEIKKPQEDLVSTLGMSITHFNHDDYGTNFHKDTHLDMNHANSPFEVKAGNTLRRWDTKPTNDAHLKAPDGFQYALNGLDASKVTKYFTDHGNRDEAEYQRVATKPSEVEPFWAGQGTAEYNDLMNGFYTAEDHYKGTSNEAMPAWDGGEMLTLNTFRQFAYNNDADHSVKDLKIPDDILTKIETWLNGYNNAAPTPAAYAEMCKKYGYVLLRVGHVNHQAFYHPAGWAGLSELVGAEAAESGSWKFDLKDYVPLTYSFEYEYPMLGDFNTWDSTFGSKPANSANSAKRKAPSKAAEAAADPKINKVKAPSTGFLPFDGSILDSDPIPTGVDNVNADSAANANGWLTVGYDSNSATVSVRSNDAVGRVDIVSLSGSVVASRTAEGTLVELNVSHLAPGAYIVSVNGRGAKKIII